MREFIKDKLKVKVMDNRTEMGEVAAKDIHECIVGLLGEKEEINMIFAAAPSQNDVIESLISYDDIDWNRINAFHMDEYIGLDKQDADAGFGKFLYDRIFGKVPFKSVNYINGDNPDYEAECHRYSELLIQNPTDIVVMGIGENGHIAFNDPWVADFNDKCVVKAVKLDEVCRQQQVNDGCFPCLSRVPETAITLTCPTLMKATYKFCIVPAPTKANAVKNTINNEINEDCPATILRVSDNAILYLDDKSSELI